MRLVVVTVIANLMCAPAWAQQPAVSRPPATGIYVSAADVAALAAKQPKDKNAFPRLIELLPYYVTLEHRVVLQDAAIHDNEAELFYVVDGAGTLVTGGKLVDAKRRDANNQGGSRIEGGTSQKIARGDFIMVPEGVPHWFSENNGPLTVMSLHLPRAADKK